MSTKSQDVGTTVLRGIDTLEAGAHDTVHAGAASARHMTKASSRWAARQEVAATRKARMLKRDLKMQAVHLRKSVDKSVGIAGAKARHTLATTNQYVKRNPWKAIAIASGAGMLLGALLHRRQA